MRMRQRARIAAIIALCATVAVLVTALLGACTPPLPPVTPPAVQPARLMTVATPYLYRVWWDKIEQCSGLRRSIDEVGFVIVGSPFFMFRGEAGLRMRAAAFLAPDSVYLGLFSTSDSALVMHEFLHAMRPGRDGEADGGHPRQDFQGPCRSLIAHGDEDTARKR